MTNELYYERKAKGLCPYCGSVLPPRWGYIRCMACRMKEKDYHKQKVIIEKYEERIEEHKTQMLTLDEMSILSKENHISYGKLQSLETVRRLKGGK